MNGISIPGLGLVPVIDLKERDNLKSLPAQGPTALEHLGSEIGLSSVEDAHISDFLARDNQFQRQAFGPVYAAARAGLVAALREGLLKARTAAGNSDLREEVRQAKVLAEVDPLLGSIREALYAALESLRQRLSFAETSVSAALKPQGNDTILELRAAEVRRHLRSLEPGARLKIMAQAAEAGRLEVLAAVSNDPLGLLDVSGIDIEAKGIGHSKRLALEVMGRGWMAVELDDARDLLAEGAGRMDALAAFIRMGLGSAPFSLTMRADSTERTLLAEALDRINSGSGILPVAE